MILKCHTRIPGYYSIFFGELQGGLTSFGQMLQAGLSVPTARKNIAKAAEAGSGDIRGEGIAKNMWSVRTGSGNVNLRLPSDAAFDVDVSSSSGTVTMGHPVTTTIQGRVQESRKSIVGKVRGGGPTISVHTGSGDIHVD